MKQTELSRKLNRLRSDIPHGNFLRIQKELKKIYTDLALNSHSIDFKLRSVEERIKKKSNYEFIRREFMDIISELESCRINTVDRWWAVVNSVLIYAVIPISPVLFYLLIHKDKPEGIIISFGLYCISVTLSIEQSKRFLTAFALTFIAMGLGQFPDSDQYLNSCIIISSIIFILYVVDCYIKHVKKHEPFYFFKTPT